MCIRDRPVTDDFPICAGCQGQMAHNKKTNRILYFAGNGAGLMACPVSGLLNIQQVKMCIRDSKRIVFIFQQFNLLPVLTAKENIIMPLLMDTKQPDEAYLKQLTELFGIQGRLDHLPHELSGGQQLSLIHILWRPSTP